MSFLGYFDSGWGAGILEIPDGARGRRRGTFIYAMYNSQELIFAVSPLQARLSVPLKIGPILTAIFRFFSPTVALREKTKYQRYQIFNEKTKILVPLIFSSRIL